MKLVSVSLQTKHLYKQISLAICLGVVLATNSSWADTNHVEASNKQVKATNNHVEDDDFADYSKPVNTKATDDDFADSSDHAASDDDFADLNEQVAATDDDFADDGDYAKDTKDPWEDFNRGVYKFNDTVDRYSLKPIAKGYEKITPKFVRTGVSNMFDNLGEARNFGNNVLQFKLHDAGVDLARFGFNSTFGLLGFFDVGTKMGLQRSDQDFGITLAKWGVPSGPFLMIPFLGPSTVRDATGLAPDFFMSVSPYINDNGVQYSMWGGGILDTRTRLLSLEKMIVGDAYIFIRNGYLETREYKINGYVEDDF